MEAYGATFLKKQPTGETATGRTLDSVESVSPLQDMVVRFADSMNNALRVHAVWLNQAEGGTVTMTSDFGPDTIDKEMNKHLMQMRKDRDISRLTAIKQAKRLGVLPEDYDAEEDFQQLVEEDKVLKPLQPQIPGTFDPTVEDGASRKTPGEGKDTTPTPRSKEE